MKKVRFGEQRAAALAGRYGAMIQLGYASREVKGPEAGNLVGELAAILRAARPETVYTHNLADKHDTHVAVALAAMGAIRSLRPADRPKRVYGCEVWRDLDWLPDARKIALPLAGHENLETALLGVFDSQIAGGKRYDLAIPGRRRSNATFLQSHGVDTAERMIFAMDLTPLARDPSIAPADYVAGLVAEFSADVADRFGRLGGAQ
jgi:LmbE family N-acetylglucosaminyl deacetylase